MADLDKKTLTERDICTKFITPALAGQDGAKWNVMTQLREEYYFTRGRVIVRGKTVKRGDAKKADYLLFYKPNIPIAVIEAKDNNHTVGAGMQQALEYAEILDVPFAYSSNGDAFFEHDRTVTSEPVEREISLHEFPTPDELWARFCQSKTYSAKQATVATQDYFDDASGKSPRYYQLIAINRTVDAIAKGENRILLVMATGTGKTYTAFQIIWRLWKSGAKKRILFLVDRNILADQTKTNDFKPFGQAMTKITNRTVDKAFEIYLSLYQAVTGMEEEQNIYKQFSPDFFDLVVVLHGNLDNAAERVLNKAEYDTAYGNDGNIHFDFPLPKLLKRLFTSYSFLFLGCSLSADRTIQTFMRVAQLEGQDNLPHHYALLACPTDATKKANIDQRLADAHITPLWYPDGEHEHVEQILELLLD